MVDVLTTYNNKKNNPSIRLSPSYSISLGGVASAGDKRLYFIEKNKKFVLIDVGSSRNGEQAAIDKILKLSDSEISSQLDSKAVSETEANESMDRIEKLSLSDHRNIVNDERWKRIYGQGKHNLYYINQDFNPFVQAEDNYKVDAMPCHACGLLLPIGLIEIDHRAPKSKASAVLKVIHMLGNGYTKQPGGGTKASNFAAIETADASVANTTLPIIGPKYKKSESTGYKDQDSKDRHTLSDKGAVFVSIMYMYWGEVDAAKKCANSFVNLEPLCGSCNHGEGKSAAHNYYKST
jgi:hypothetical protein